MNLLPKFEIFNQGKIKIGKFQLTEINPETDELFLEADDLFHEYEYEKSKILLERILRNDPSLDEAYFLLAEIARDKGDFIQAEKILAKGIHFFKSLIPADFTGDLPWGFDGNRPFLRLHHDLLLTYNQNGKLSEAIETGLEILNYDPDDSQGIRWLMGDLYLKNGELPKAEKFLKNNVIQYPPLQYSLALLYFIQNKKWDAISQFRLGFLENIYISEILSFKAPLISYDLFEPTNLNGIEVANEYAMSMTEYWIRNADALDFMEAIQKHPLVYIEINRVYSLLHELNHLSYDDTYLESIDDSDFNLDMREFNRDARKEIFDEIDNIKRNINKSSSKKILRDLDNLFEQGL